MPPHVKKNISGRRRNFIVANYSTNETQMLINFIPAKSYKPVDNFLSIAALLTWNLHPANIEQ